MVEDCLFRSDMERLNNNLVLSASFLRNERGTNEASGFETKGCLGFFVAPMHTHSVNVLQLWTLKILRTFTGRQNKLTEENFFAEHTIIFDPESPEMWLMKWDSTWESLVCSSYCYLVPQASSLFCCWSQDCRLAACLGSDQYSHSYLLPGLKSSFSIFAFLWLRLLS